MSLSFCLSWIVFKRTEQSKWEQNKKQLVANTWKLGQLGHSHFQVFFFFNLKLKKLKIIWQQWAHILAWNQLAGAEEWVPSHYHFHRWDSVGSRVRLYPQGHKSSYYGVRFQTSSNPIKNHKNCFCSFMLQSILAIAK